MAKKTKGGTTNPSYNRNNLKNTTIDRLRKLEPGSSFNTEDAVSRARENARYTTGIAPKDTVNVTGYTADGKEYQMFAKKGSPNHKQQQEFGGISNAFRPKVHNSPEEDPYYVGNYNYKPKNSKKNTNKNAKK